MSISTVKRLRFENEEIYDTMTLAAWQSQYAGFAMFAVELGDTLYDVTEWIGELQITHNELDKEGAGRDVNTGKMVRKYAATKHDIQIKVVDKCPQAIAHSIFALVDTNPSISRYSFNAWIQWPCGTQTNGSNLHSFNCYCSTVNYGAQRYDRNDRKCYYYGMSFKIVEM